jgi:DNA-binding HxlR family transcriptional regulator
MATMTAGARRDHERNAYNAMLASCPTRQLLDVLSDKWVCLVLTALTGGSRRHSELGREIAGVSQKMLTQTLRRLERDGLVRRTLTVGVPVRADYELTPLGQDLAPLLGAIKVWAETHMDAVLAARGQRDTGS